MSLPEACSEGGPVIAIPAELASSWGGVDNGDYDRACNAEDHTNLDYGAIGVVTVGSGRARALDLELLTAFLETPAGGVIIRRYEDDPLNAEAARSLMDGIEAEVGVIAVSPRRGDYAIHTAVSDGMEFIRLTRAQ